MGGVCSGERTQAGNQAGNRLLHTACKSWRLGDENGAVCSAGENPHSSSGSQTEPDLQAEKMKPLVFVPQTDHSVSGERGSHSTAKWVFLEKSLSAALTKVHNYLSRTFSLLLELCVNRLIPQSQAALTKPTHRFHKWSLSKGHLREIMMTGSASFLFLFRLIFYFHSSLFIHVFCFLMENITKDFYLDIYW